MSASEKEPPLIVHPPDPDAPALRDFEFPPPPDDLDSDVDAVDVLLELRQNER